MRSQDPNDPKLHERVRHALDEAADDLDMVTAARLQSARLRAVERAGRGSPWSRWWGVLLPAGATAALLAALVYTPPQEQAAPIATAELARDLDLITASESLDFYEDLEFFRWLPAAKRS